VTPPDIPATSSRRSTIAVRCGSTSTTSPVPLDVVEPQAPRMPKTTMRASARVRRRYREGGTRSSARADAAARRG
jgi:hypothetical protein